MESDLSINSITFNQDLTAFSVATSRGFEFYKSSPIKLLGRCDLDCALKVCEMYYTTNVFALVGKSSTTTPFNSRTVTFWDNYRQAEVGRQVYQSNVTGVKMRKDRAVVAAENSIFVYSLMELVLLKTLVTGPNIEGLVSYSFDSPDVLVCPHPEPGSVYVIKGGSEVVLRAHKSELSAIALNKAGTVLATTSSKGTLIRLFKTDDLSRLFEFRRGVSSAAITSLVFHPTELFIACSSLKGTVHIYSLIEGKNTSSVVSFARAFLPSYFSSEWSSLNFRVPEGPNKVAFTKDGLVTVVKTDGTAYVGNYVQAVGGEVASVQSVSFVTVAQSA
jgi:WD40 repeat protein